MLHPASWNGERKCTFHALTLTLKHMLSPTLLNPAAPFGSSSMRLAVRSCAPSGSMLVTDHPLSPNWKVGLLKLCPSATSDDHHARTAADTVDAMRSFSSPLTSLQGSSMWLSPWILHMQMYMQAFSGSTVRRCCWWSDGPWGCPGSPLSSCCCGRWTLASGHSLQYSQFPTQHRQAYVGHLPVYFVAFPQPLVILETCTNAALEAVAINTSLVKVQQSLRPEHLAI